MGGTKVRVKPNQSTGKVTGCAPLFEIISPTVGWHYSWGWVGGGTMKLVDDAPVEIRSIR